MMNTECMLFRNTAAHTGRKRVITPENSDLEYLSYGRTILKAGDEPVTFNTGDEEVVLLCMNGEGTIEAGGQTYTLKKWDALFAAAGVDLKLSTESSVDFLECAAPTEKKGTVQFVPFDSVKDDPKLAGVYGEVPFQRTIYKIIDDNVDASRLLVGVTFSEPGNWTSWPPHEHADTKEEIYVYCDMPTPAFGVQFAYTDLKNMEFVQPVYDGDAVVLKEGYHPNVAAPGHRINFVWILAALRPTVDRSWTAVRTQPEFSS